MGASKEIKALLSLSEKKQSDLMSVLNMSSRQSLSNKFTNERWSADDLLAIAKFCGGSVAFITKDGQQIVLSDSAQCESNVEE